MRKRTLISLILTVIMIITASGLASAADSWKYYFPITVSDTSGATRTMYPIILEVGGDSLVDGGYLTANGTDARLRTTADKNLLMSSDNIAFVVDSLPADGQVTYNLYTGYSPEIDAFQIIVGDGGYVTVADEPSIELGDNFSIEQGGWWDTDSGGKKKAVYKPLAFQTYISATENVTSTVDTTLDFDGADDLVTCDNQSVINNIFDGGGSIEAWIDADSDGEANTGRIVAKYAASGWIIGVREEAGGKVKVELYYTFDGSAGTWKTTATEVTLNTWTHIAITYDADNVGNTAIIYVDGASKAVDETSPVGTRESDAAHDFIIGNTADKSTTFDGEIAEVRVYDDILTPTEVAEHAAGSFAVDTDLVLHLPMNEGLGLIAWDMTVNDNDGTIDGATWGGETVTAIDVTSGEHTIETKADQTLFGIGRDTVNADFPPISDNAVLIAPLWHSELDASPFTTKDLYEHSCTVTGATWSAAKGRWFDGGGAADDLITVPQAASINNLFDNGGTIIAWIDVASDGEVSNASILNKTSADDGWYFQMYQEAAGVVKLQFYQRTTTGGKFLAWGTDDTVVTINTPTMVAATYNSTAIGNNAIIYVDDTIPAVTRVGTGTGVREDDSGSDLILGNNAATTRTIDGYIMEAFAYDSILTPQELSDFYDATIWKYDGSTEYFHYNLLPTGDVPDNANDWSFLQNNVMPYADNIIISVNGTRELWFEPIEMITGTTLPDRATSVANDGTITWGSNDGVEIVFGSVTSYEATVSAATVNTTGFVLPLVGIPDNWWGMEFDGEDLPFYPTFLDTSTQTGIPVQTLYLLMVFGVAIALATVTIVMTRSVVVGVAFYTITMSYGANAGIVAWWIIYVFLIMVVGIIFLSSRQAMGG